MKWQVTEVKRIKNRHIQGEDYVETEITLPKYIIKKLQRILDENDHGYALVEIDENVAIFAGLDLDLGNGFSHHWETIIADFDTIGIYGVCKYIIY